MEKYLIELPEDIKCKIQSYLYFSDEKSNNIKLINFLIKNHNNSIFTYLYIKFAQRCDVLNKRIFKFFIIEENNKIYEKIKKQIIINFDDYYNIKQTEKIIKSLSYYDLNKLFDYVMFKESIY